MRRNHSIEIKPNFGHNEIHVALSPKAARTVAGVVNAEFPVLAAQLVAAAVRLEDHTTTTANRRVNRDQINQTNQLKEVAFMIDEPTPPPTGDRLTLTVREVRLLSDTVCLFAGHDDGRPALRMVHFEPCGTGTRAVATDSYALAWYDDIQTDLGGVSVNIEAKTLRKAAKKTRGLLLDNKVNFVRADGFWTADNLPLKRWTETPLIAYPSTAAFIDAWQPETHCDSVRLGYTLNVLNKVYEINDTSIEFSFGPDPLKPVSFSFVWGKDEATEIRGVCMPMKPTNQQQRD